MYPFSVHSILTHSLTTPSQSHHSTPPSTAYIFVGVASSSADLSTFLGGCPCGWGFIGEQAIYHNREKVKIYGEAFNAGDVVGVVLDLNNGTLSFSRNGKMLGIAFDKIYGEVFPAVAFYNVGQELELLPDGFHTTCPCEPIPCSLANRSRLTHSVGEGLELMLCLQERAALSSRQLAAVAAAGNEWLRGTLQVRLFVGLLVGLLVQLHQSYYYIIVYYILVYILLTHSLTLPPQLITTLLLPATHTETRVGLRSSSGAGD